MAVGNMVNQIATYTDPRTGKQVTVTPASQGGYMNAYNTYYADTEAEKAAKRKELDTRLAENNATTNANYDRSARQAYVQYMQRQRALPSQLQSLGVRGGATESGLLNLYNNYGSTHAANEQQRNADLTTNQQNTNDAWTAYTEQLEADRRDRYQTALNNQMNEYKNAITEFASAVAQHPTTKKGYEAYKKWITDMQNSSDPLKDIKVALIRQQMATQFPNGAPSSGGSGGGGGGGSRRSYGGRSYGGNDSDNNKSKGVGYSGNTRAAYEKRFGKTTKNNTKTWKKYGITKPTGRWVG